ncbi:MAG: DsbA family protein [Acidimicrobiales bacterium]
MTTSFAVTWDYRCPFARNAHEHLLTAVEAGADWEVQYRAFALDQAHVEEGAPAVWEEPDRYPGLLANLAGIAVRDRDPEHFPAVHRGLFAARHDHALDLRDRDVVAAVLKDHGVDATAVLAEVEDGWPLETLRQEHTVGVEKWGVFGVPTFIAGDRAVFVRLLDRPDGAAGGGGEGGGEKSRSHIERILGLIDGWPELNEFKYTAIPR